MVIIFLHTSIRRECLGYHHRKEKHFLPPVLCIEPLRERVCERDCRLCAKVGGRGSCLCEKICARGWYPWKTACVWGFHSLDPWSTRLQCQDKSTHVTMFLWRYVWDLLSPVWVSSNVCRGSPLYWYESLVRKGKRGDKSIYLFCHKSNFHLCVTGLGLMTNSKL